MTVLHIPGIINSLHPHVEQPRDLESSPLELIPWSIILDLQTFTEITNSSSFTTFFSQKRSVIVTLELHCTKLWKLFCFMHNIATKRKKEQNIYALFLFIYI